MSTIDSENISKPEPQPKVRRKLDKKDRAAARVISAGTCSGR